MVAVAERRPTDEQLGERTGTGDAEAFAALYDRYFQGIYDFALRILRDRDATADVVQLTFAKTWETMRRRRIENVKAWLYALAHNAAIDEARQRRRLVPAREQEDAEGGFPIFTEVDTSRLADPATVVRDRELVELVWKSAAALGAEGYALLDLHVRKGLTLDELAPALRVKKGTLDTRVSRLKVSLERSVIAGCQETRQRHASPLAIFAALAPVPVLPSLRDGIWAGIQEVLPRPPGASFKVTKTVVALSAAGVLAAGAAGGVIALRGGGLHDPTSIRSTTHEIGEATSDTAMTMRWTPEPGATGYSVLWSDEPALPDETIDLDGDETGTNRVLTPGRWWFNLRTRGEDGDWTHTAQIGPYVVVPVPDTTIASGPRRLSNDGTPVFQLEATGEGSFECRLDGGPFERCGARTAVGRIDDGRHRLEARVRDRFGNVDASVAVWVWRVDTTAPRTRIDSAHFEQDTATFSFSARERRVVFECSADGGAFRRCRSPVSLDGLSEGEHEFAVRARDEAGNRDSSPAGRRWSVDTTPPETTILSGPSGLVHRTKATFGLKASESDASFECSLDRGAYQACASTVTYVGLSAGEHRFRVRARDKADNIDSTPARRRWTIVIADTSPPNTTITSHPPANSGRSAATFRFSSSESGSTFECRLDGGSWRSCSSPRTYNGLAVGPHVFLVRARDAAGNIDPTPAAWNWAIH